MHTRLDVDPQVAALLRARIAKRNRGLIAGGVLEIVTGVIWLAITMAVTFGFTWLFIGVPCRSLFSTDPLVVAIGATGAYFVASFIAAWRGDDPTEDLDPDVGTRGPLALFAVVFSGPPGRFHNPRHGVAGAAMALIGGPASILSGIGSIRHRLRADDRTVLDAAQLLEAASQRGVPGADVPSDAAVRVLRRLHLVKFGVGRSGSEVVATEKGCALVRGVAS